MPLYIRDDAVDRLTEEVMHATGAKNKTEAVRMALQAQLKAAREGAATGGGQRDARGGG